MDRKKVIEMLQSNDSEMVELGIITLLSLDEKEIMIVKHMSYGDVRLVANIYPMLPRKCWISGDNAIYSFGYGYCIIDSSLIGIGRYSFLNAYEKVYLK